MRYCLLICALPALLAAAPSPGLPLTVVLDFEHVKTSVPLPAVQSELQKLLSAANLTVDLRLRNELPDSPQLGQVVIFKMRGFCSTDPAIPVGALSDERGALAMTYTSDGQILPFGEVECDRVRQSLSRLWGQPLPKGHETDLALAIARVLAHEVYHMLGDSVAHTRTGVTKESLTARELTQPELSFPKAAQVAVNPTGTRY